MEGGQVHAPVYGGARGELPPVLQNFRPAATSRGTQRRGLRDGGFLARSQYDLRMKNRHVCPKCAGKRIWIIERFRVPALSGEGKTPGTVLPVAQAEAAPAGLFAFATVKTVGHFDLFLCDGCGYSELWAEGFRGLEADPERGIRLLDTSETSAGPFR